MTHTSVKREIVINAPKEKVWDYLTLPEQRNKWETHKCEINLTIGGEINLDYGWGVSYSGTFKKIIPYEQLIIESLEDQSLTIWSIIPHQNSCIVSIEYTGEWISELEVMEMENMAFGTYQFLRNFKSILEDEIDIRSTFWLSWLGIHHISKSSKDGVKVVQVVPHTPATDKIEVDDHIFSINDENIFTYDEFESKVTQLKPNSKVKIKLRRNNKEKLINLETIPFATQLNT